MTISETCTDDFDQKPWYPIENDHLKNFCCLPFIGVIASLCIQENLNAQIMETGTLERTVELLELTNEYKLSAIVSSVTSAAASALMSGGLVPAIALGLSAGYFYSSIKHNEHLIAHINNPNSNIHASLKLLAQ